MKRIILLLAIPFLSSSLFAQSLEDLSFGTDASLEVLTWNLELFPTNGATTISNVSQALSAIAADVMAFQEINDETLFTEMINAIGGYQVSVGSSGGDWKLAYVYRSDVIEVNAVYEIYTSSQYSNPFPRRPLVFDFNYLNENYIVINNHYKCCGDGVIDLGDQYDDETRRYLATNLIKDYIDANFPGKKVFVVGDLNDEVTDDQPNNVFQKILDDPENYLFADYQIAIGSSSNWSYPSWPSHLDHIIITNELFEAYNSNSTVVQVLKIDSYLTGGLTEYYQNFSDHRPVAIKFAPDGNSNTTNIFKKDFEDQSITSGGWATYNVVGSQSWIVPTTLYGHNNSYCAYVNGYNAGPQENENWLVSPSFFPNSYENLTFSFWNTSGYSGPQLQVFYSSNFTDNPATANWTEITDAIWHNGVTSWEWTFSGDLDLSELTGEAVNIAFKYTSTSTQAAAWEIDDILLTGQFTSFVISATANPSNGGTVSGAGNYEPGETADLVATPAAGYDFINWTENGIQVSTNSTYSFEVTQNRVLVANLEIKTFTITVNITPENSGSATGAGTYNYGEIVELFATPNTNWIFEKWIINSNEVLENPTNITVTENLAITVVFIESEPNYTLTIAKTGIGTTIPEVGTYTFEEGSVVNLSATNDPGWKFEKWLIKDYEIRESSTSITIDENITATAVFTVASAIDELSNDEIQLFPNPTKDLLSIQNVKENVIVAIYDINGKLVLEQIFERNFIDISWLKSGFYTLRIKVDHEIIHRKFVKL